MTPELQRLIDIRMFVEYRAKPIGPWGILVASSPCRMTVYESASQRLWVEYHPDTRAVAVYSFTKSFEV